MKPARHDVRDHDSLGEPSDRHTQSVHGFPQSRRLQPDEEQQRDDHIHGGPGKRHPQLLEGFVRHPLQSGDPSDGKKRDVTSPDPVAPRRERVAEFVEHDACKEREDESDALDDGLDALTLVPVDEGDPGDHHEEGGVHVEVNARDPCQFP